MTLSTHVLDLDLGGPAVGVPVRAERQDDGTWVPIAGGVTDRDGRISELVPAARWRAGTWRIVVDVAAYHGADAFWSELAIAFVVPIDSHHHVPVLLARHGATTYRGS